jgi:hypothetical protein
MHHEGGLGKEGPHPGDEHSSDIVIVNWLGKGSFKNVKLFLRQPYGRGAHFLDGHTP